MNVIRNTDQNDDPNLAEAGAQSGGDGSAEAGARSSTSKVAAQSATPEAESQSSTSEAGAQSSTSDAAARSERESGLSARIRPLRNDASEDVFLPFLDLCFNWSMDKPRVEVAELLEREDAGFYFKGWGRNGDIAVAAYAQAPEPHSADEGDSSTGIVGLAWLRLAEIESVIGRSSRANEGAGADAHAVLGGHSGTDLDSSTGQTDAAPFTGYGWVAADIPELSIAVLPDHQGQGIGGMLLDVVCTLAKMSGFQAVSLSVEDGNGAARLYHDHGFVSVGRNADSDILVRRLS